MKKFCSLLSKQLKQIGISYEQLSSSDLKVWEPFLDKVEKTYNDFEECKRAMENSLDIAVRQMERLNNELNEKRNKLQAVMSEGLCFIGDGWLIESLNPEAERLLNITTSLAGEKVYEALKIFDPVINGYVNKSFLDNLVSKG